jgi:pyridoxamine-phosphate oxidase
VSGRERELRREDLLDDPIRQFVAWYEEARAEAEAIPSPEACALATASRGGHPSVRMVLLKDVDERGFVFATSYASRKGRELAENARAALLFHWHPLGRQVRVEGPVEQVSAAESDAIFLARPRESRVSALASSQSEPLASREQLEARVRELAKLATEHGHMAEVVELAEGGLAIRHCNCPIQDVAARTGLPCVNEQQMYERLLGTPVTRSTWMAETANDCTYEVKKSGGRVG